MKILIVDDDPGSRSALKLINEYYGHEVNITKRKKMEEDLELKKQFAADLYL